SLVLMFLAGMIGRVFVANGTAMQHRQNRTTQKIVQAHRPSAFVREHRASRRITATLPVSVKHNSQSWNHWDRRLRFCRLRLRGYAVPDGLLNLNLLPVIALPQ